MITFRSLKLQLLLTEALQLSPLRLKQERRTYFYTIFHYLFLFFLFRFIIHFLFLFIFISRIYCFLSLTHFKFAARK